MIQADIIICDGGGGDISIHFITPDFYEEFKWSAAEIALESSDNNKDKWQAAGFHAERISCILGDAIENNDYRILKTIYSQAYTDGEKVNAEFKIGRIMNLNG